MVATDIPEFIYELLDAGDCAGARDVLRSEECSMSAERARELWEQIREKERLLEV